MLKDLRRSCAVLQKDACRYCTKLHRITAVLGLLLLVGWVFVELMKVPDPARFFEALDILLSWMLGFVLIANVPLALASLFLCRKDTHLIIQSGLLLVFAGLLWFMEEFINAAPRAEGILTLCFFGYVFWVIYFTWKDKWPRERPPGNV